MQHQDNPLNAEEKISLGMIGDLMAFMGYPVNSSHLHPEPGKLTGLCYGITYTDAFSILNKDIDRFEKRKQLLAQLINILDAQVDLQIRTSGISGEIIEKINNLHNTQSKLGMLECGIQDDHISIEDKNKLKNIKEKLTLFFENEIKDKTFFNEKVLVYLQSYFDTIIQFHQNIAIAGMGNSGRQIAFSYLKDLTPLSYQDSKIEFCHPLITIARVEGLSVLLGKLENIIQQDISMPDDPIVFMVDSTIKIDNTHSSGHTILFSYNKHHSCFEVITSAPYELHQHSNINEVSKKILTEFSNKLELDANELHGLSICPITNNPVLAKNFNDQISLYMNSKEWKDQFLKPLRGDEKQFNDCMNAAIRALIVSATYEQTKMLFSTPLFHLLIKNKSVYIDRQYNRNITISDFVIGNRLFEKDTDKIIHYLFKEQGIDKEHFSTYLISNIITYNQDIINRKLNNQHLSCADKVFSVIASHININNMDKNNKYSYPLLHSLIYIVYMHGITPGGKGIERFDFANDLIKILLKNGSNPNIAVDFNPGNQSKACSILLSLTLLLKNNLNNQDKVEGILSCIHVLIEHGARWMQDEIKNNPDLFERVNEIFKNDQINPNMLTEVSDNPLSMAVRNGNLDTVKTLIKNGAVVDMDHLSIAANSEVKNADADEILRELIDALFKSANPSGGISLFSENDKKFYQEATNVFNQFIHGMVEAHALEPINQAFMMYPFKEIVEIVGEPSLIRLHESAKVQMLRSKNI